MNRKYQNIYLTGSPKLTFYIPCSSKYYINYIKKKYLIINKYIIINLY